MLTEQPLTVDTKGLYYMRNRWYSPQLGRLLQMDMNESASLVVAALAMNGETFANFVSAFASTGHYGDGMNLYQYAGGNPVTLRDPAGLNPWDEPYDDVVETITGIYAARTSAAMDFDRFFKCMAVTAGTMVIESMVCALVPGGAFLVGMHHMALAAANIDENGLTWGNALEFAAGAAPFAGKAIGGFFGVLGEMRGARAMKGAPGPYAVGAFSIFDWSGYPARVRRPQGPFVLLEGAAYDAARTAANKAVAAYRRANPQCADKFVHHIHPVKFGGDPTNPANFAIVDKATHDALNSFWARHQRDATPH
ncbi:MAG: hypothetical protein KA383_17960 [Phycisphaerae bacterium]|nr:hypothetical protein [Phycisphaerae bacterium]